MMATPLSNSRFTLLCGPSIVRLAARFLFLVALFCLLANGIRWIRHSSEKDDEIKYPRSIKLAPARAGTIVECPLSVENPSSKEVTLNRFGTSCSCAGVERRIDGQLVRPESIAIPAQSKIDLVVRISIGTKTGYSQTVGVVFQTAEPEPRTHSIEVIIPRIEGPAFADPSTVVLGDVSQHAKAKSIVYLFDNGQRELKIVSAKSSHPKRFDVCRIPLSDREKEIAHANAGHLLEKFEVIANTHSVGLLDGLIEVQFQDSNAPLFIPVCGSVKANVWTVALSRPFDRTIRSLWKLP